jgi:hypothetical protein
LFHLIPIPTTAFYFSIAVIIYYLSGLVFLLSYQRYALLIFFIAGSIVDNVHVNFAVGGHSRYLEYSLFLPVIMALFLKADGKSYLNAHRALVAAYYFVAGLYKFSNAGFKWGLDDSIFVHAVAVQTSTPIKEWVLSQVPELFRVGAYVVFLAELFSPLILFFRSARWIIVAVLFAFHLTFPLVWGGHRDFVVNCICLTLCLSDEVFINKIFLKYEYYRKSLVDFILKAKGKIHV